MREGLLALLLIPQVFIAKEPASKEYFKKWIGSDEFIIQSKSLYDFGILTSAVHNCWMRSIAGRLKSDYRYSKEIVYNNFPWPEANKKQQEKIAKLAQAVLDARKQFPGSSLADLYDPRTMPPVLLEAHQNLDRGVMRLYGFSARMTDSAIVAKLFELYQNIVMK